LEWGDGGKKTGCHVDQWGFLIWIVVGAVVGWVVGRGVETGARRRTLSEAMPSLSDLPDDDFDELRHQQRVDLVAVRTDLSRCADCLEVLGRDLKNERTGYAEPQWNRGPSVLESMIWHATRAIQGAVGTLKLPAAVESRTVSERPPLDRLRARSEFLRYQFDPGSNLHLMSVKMPLPNGGWTVKNAAGVDVDALALQLLKELDEAEAARVAAPRTDGTGPGLADGSSHG
jgi:hypothetical protein